MFAWLRRQLRDLLPFLPNCDWVQPIVHNRILRKRSAFAITETELKLIAAPAITGLNSNPKKG